MAIGIITKITQKITKTNTIKGLWALGRSESNWHIKHARVFALPKHEMTKNTIYKHSHQQLRQ